MIQLSYSKASRPKDGLIMAGAAGLRLRLRMTAENGKFELKNSKNPYSRCRVNIWNFGHFMSLRAASSHPQARPDFSGLA